MYLESMLEVLNFEPILAHPHHQVSPRVSLSIRQFFWFGNQVHRNIPRNTSMIRRGRPILLEQVMPQSTVLQRGIGNHRYGMSCCKKLKHSDGHRRCWRNHPVNPCSHRFNPSSMNSISKHKYAHDYACSVHPVFCYPRRQINPLMLKI